ncbi:hypothetical protein LOK49_LG02G01729 [Camellia lanceoleosa]|uniref:Uncharacterized protein n=1 Tax=Camellia lanceoleosa TaxID=1840588 RepID=A0ACC0IMH3_9ERIC|nr:hypothetical protein LOK49_LG02G01729 [Camellia lanceoleosa]
MELQHFSHEHPLILGEVNDDGEAIVCDVCWENISGSAFSCKNCLFFLHKFCAEFPEEMNHPIHAHSLTLQQSSSSTMCDVCDDNIRGFSYRCSPCDFDVDIRCSVRGQHFSSKHQLMILNEDEKNDVDERLSCHLCLQQITVVVYVIFFSTNGVPSYQMNWSIRVTHTSSSSSKRPLSLEDCSIATAADIIAMDLP